MIQIGKIYISGPVSGTFDYMERFQAAEDKLERGGFSVVNPVRVNAELPENTTHEEYMSVSMELLKMCDYVYMMEGWERSTGANREYGYAMGAGIIIITEQELKQRVAARGDD